MTINYSGITLQLILSFLALLLTTNAVAVNLTVQTKPIKHQTQYQAKFPVLGIIKPMQQTVLAFETQGRIKTIHKDLGDSVTQGELLASLDCSDKKAQLDLAHARTRQGETRYKQAQRDQIRAANLFANGDIALQIKEQNDNTLEIAKSELTVLKASGKVRQVQYEQCYLLAPWDGRITKRITEVGQFVTPAQHSLELQSSTLEVEAWLPMRFSSLIATNHSKNLYAQATLTDSAQMIRIKLKQSSDVIDAQRMAILTKWDIDTDLWNVGKSIIINIKQVHQTNGFWVDRSAVTNSIEGLLHIFVVNDENKVENYQVELLHTEQEKLFVTGPIADGMQYVSLGSSLLVAGQSVFTTEAK